MKQTKPSIIKQKISDKFQTLYRTEGEFYASAGRINLVKAELYDAFIATAKASFTEKYGHEPVEIPVVISDGARRLA